MLHSDLSGQLSDSVHEVLSFSVDDLLHIFKLSADLTKLLLDFLDFLSFDAQFFLLIFEVLLKGKLLFLLLLELLSHSYLLSPFLLEIVLGPQQLLFLFHCLFHCLSSSQELFFHPFDLLQQL